MLTTMEKLIFLKRVPLFTELNSDILIAIGEIVTEKNFPAGQHIFHENEMGDTLYIILAGEVEISKIFADKEKKVLSRLQVTEFFGEMSIFDDRPRSATALAVKDTTLLSIQKSQFRDLISEYPEIMFEMYKVAIQRLRNANE